MFSRTEASNKLDGVVIFSIIISLKISELLLLLVEYQVAIRYSCFEACSISTIKNPKEIIMILPETGIFITIPTTKNENNKCSTNSPNIPIKTALETTRAITPAKRIHLNFESVNSNK